MHKEIQLLYESLVGNVNENNIPHSEYIGEIIARFYEKGR